MFFCWIFPWTSTDFCIILTTLTYLFPINNLQQPCFYLVIIIFCYKPSQRPGEISVSETDLLSQSEEMKYFHYYFGLLYIINTWGLIYKHCLLPIRSLKEPWAIFHQNITYRKCERKMWCTLKIFFFFIYLYNSWYHLGDKVSVATLEAKYWNEAKSFNDTYHTIHVALANYSLLIIISLTMSHPKHFFFRHSALQFVQKHFSILNDTSLWADNWRDSVNCDKLKVWSNYTDSHRRIKVSASLCGATPLMRQCPIIETRHPLRGMSSVVPWLPLMGPILLLVHWNMFFQCQLCSPPTSSFLKRFSWQRSRLLIEAARFVFSLMLGTPATTNKQTEHCHPQWSFFSDVYSDFPVTISWMTTWFICISIFTTGVSLTVSVIWGVNRLERFENLLLFAKR